MAAKWDHKLMKAERETVLNGSFKDNKEKGKTKNPNSTKQMSLLNKKDELSSASSEQSLIYGEQEEYDVTEYVMEYTDIFEPNDQKFDFVDVQEGDTILDVTDEEIVAHSSEQKTYEDTQLDTPDEDPGEGTSEEDEKLGTLGTDEDSRLVDRATEEHYEQEVGSEQELDMDNEIHQQNQVKSKSNGLNNDEGAIPEKHEISERTDEEKESNGRKELQSDDEEGRSEVEEGHSEVEEGHSEVEEGHSEVEEGHSEDEEIEVQPKIDEEDEKSEVDKLLENDNDEETKISKKDKPKNKNQRQQTSCTGTQVDEEEPLLNTSHSPLPPEPLFSSHSPQTKRPFSPKAYPGKVVKSVAIGTDDHDFMTTSSSTMRDTSRHAEVGVDRRMDRKSKQKAQITNVTKKANTSHVSEYHQRENGNDGAFRKAKRERTNHSSDANFFRSRLPQTSKRHPKRHVWLVRDSEIHRLIAEKAAILRRYKDEGITGRSRTKKSFPNYSEVDVLGLPSVGFSGKNKNEGHVKPLPYDKHPSSKNHLRYGVYSSEDEDERTNRLDDKEGKPSGTFAVGLAARRDNHKNKQHELQSVEDGDGNCQLCAAETREKERQEKKLKELEATAKAGPHHPRNLMQGIVYAGKFLGSTNLMSPAAPNKAIRLQQAEEAIGRIKVPEGEEQPSSDVDLFISTERIKVVSSKQKQTLIDHNLKTISFIADIGKIIVVMARLSSDNDSTTTWSGRMPEFNSPNQEEKTAKVVCHVLETTEAQTIAKTVGQAFSIAYHEFLKVNELNMDEIEEAEYNGILEQQKILDEDLSLLVDETKAKEVVIHKKYGETLSMMIVESGWGSMVPTVVIAHLDNKGPAAKSGQLNVGNQILAVNGQSLVGLPLLECQNIIKAMKYADRVALKVVFCPPTVEMCINRPDTKYQLGFSVQNGMICSLMRGGIAERGGVRVGHKIIEMNGESVVAASHQHIVDILQTTIGELRMKTMPITLYKLMVGLEIPQYL